MPDNVKDNPVEKREALLADCLRLHKGYRQRNRNWCQHFLKAMCMADADIEFIGEDNVPSASYTYVVTGAYDNFGGKVSIGAE